MKKQVTFMVSLVSLVFLCAACVGTSNSVVMKDGKDSDKTATLSYTKVGLTSSFELKGLATGTYKRFGHEAGWVAHTGTQNIELTVDAAQHWAVKAESKRQGFEVAGFNLRLHNPYVATLTRQGRAIGTIAISMPKVDKTKGIINYMGLGNIIQRNLHLTGKAKIIDREYGIESVYENQNGEKVGAPLGYQVTRNNKVLGLVQVGKNITGGQEMTLQIKPGLGPEVEQSVVSVLLVCGYAV